MRQMIETTTSIYEGEAARPLVTSVLRWGHVITPWTTRRLMHLAERSRRTCSAASAAIGGCSEHVILLI
jgi:hypothetical protein